MTARLLQYKNDVYSEYEEIVNIEKQLYRKISTNIKHSFRLPGVDLPGGLLQCFVRDSSCDLVVHPFLWKPNGEIICYTCLLQYY